MSKIGLEFVFKTETVNKIALLRNVLRLMRQDGMPLDSLETRYGHIDSATYMSLVEKEGDWVYGFETPDIEIINGESGGFDLYKLIAIEKTIEKVITPSNWAQYFTSEQGFSTCRVFDADFDFWQNTTDPIEYQKSGRSYEKNELISNSLPYPLEDKIVDISKNPGVRIFRKGYIEAIGFEMWLSDCFFNAIEGYSTKRLQAAGWSVQQCTNGVIHLSVKPIELSDHGDIEKQRALRAALFGGP